MYLKNDMRSKFNLLNDLEVAIGFTSTMMAQQTYSGTTTIVPQVCLLDYFKVGVNVFFLWIPVDATSAHNFNCFSSLLIKLKMT